MPDFSTAAGIAALTVILVAHAREQFPEITGAGAVLLTWLLAPCLAVVGYGVGLVPAYEWQESARIGVQAAVIANGGYSAGKAIAGARRRGRGRDA